MWKRRVEGALCEVRTAGSVRRLYSDGVFHSEYSPRRYLTGQVWDLLMLPAFFCARGTIRRVLVLGVGGGTVIRQLRRFVTPSSIVGVERNAAHLHVAKRFFDAGGPETTLVCDDARRWASSYRGAPFDMIIDDLFGGADARPMRSVDMDSEWFACLLAQLSDAGVLVANFPSPIALRESAYRVHLGAGRAFRDAFSFSTPSDANVVAAFLRFESSARWLRNNLRATPGLDPAVKRNRLNYRVRRLR
ncbi:MAG: hypothetical protein MJD61_21605 [Proteobacteria bacterium]|nr:hypothetical protein [Pseudomonadota bacterium]